MKTALFTILVALSLCTASPVMAAGVHGYTALSAVAMNANKQQQKLKVSSKEQAVQLAKRQYRGKVLKVQSSRVNGNPGYSVKLLSNDGVVFYVKVDAKTGRVSRN
ncbi:PepSY domain-containing protein [Shewanella marinintestina]|uniref:PepSY domain-containing protein n=1 Tax=Shewanella marinintestina TaxID=190305 RepID=UPI00200D8936|nr:PepSY domain-containing protein [Shewanella marinintestina]MCL1145965.1 PepSY domain-containing protein [Shewanella marinintestina]